MELQWWEILSYVVGIAGILLGGAFWQKWNLVVKLLKELGEAFTKTGEALADRELTLEEAKMLLKEWLDVYKVILQLLPAKVVGLFRKPGG